MRSFLQVVNLLVFSATAVLAQAGEKPFQPELIADSGAPDSGSTYQLAASPDGKWYASGQYDGHVKIWSATDGSEYRDIPVVDPRTEGSSRMGVAVSPDSKTLIVLASDTLYLLDVPSALVSKTIAVGKNAWDMAAHPTQAIVALLDNQGNASVRSLENGAELFHAQLAGAEFDTPGGVLLKVRFSPDGTLLALTNRTRFELWSWRKGVRLLALDAHEAHGDPPAPATDAAKSAAGTPAAAGESHDFWFSGSDFSPDGRRLALCARDKLYLFSLPSAHPTLTRAIAPGLPPGCRFRTNSQLLLAQQDYGLTVLSLDSMSELTFPSVNFNDYLPLAADGRGILYASGNVYLCDANSLREISHPGVIAKQVNSVPPNALRFTKDGKQLLWSTWFRPLTSWSLESGEPSDTLLSYSFLPAFASDGYQFVMASQGLNKIQLFDVRQGKELAPLSVPINNFNAAVSMSDGGKLIAVANDIHGVGVLSGSDHALIGTLVADHPNAVALQSDGELVAVADRSGTAVYSIPDGLRRVAFLSRSAPLGSAGIEPLREMEFSRDGQWLAVMDESALNLISTKTWEARALEGPYNGQCLAFSGDSSRLAYVSYAHGATVVDVASGQQLYQDGADLHRCPIALNADGATMAVAGREHVDLIGLSSGQLRASLYLVGRGTNLDWLVATPDGLFDGTPVAWKSLAWRLSTNTFDRLPIETFFRDFYRPGLLTEVLSASPPGAPLNLASIDRRQPRVQLTSLAVSAGALADRKVSLAIAASEAAPDASHSAGSGVRDLRLFRNGTLVQTWRGALAQNAKAGAMLRADVPIVAGTNRFTAYAFSDSGIKSIDAELKITGADSLIRRGTAYVVAMGVDHYAADTPQRPLNLQYAERDAGEFIQEFSAAQKALDQFDQVRVIRLLGSDATRDNLERVLARLAGAAGDAGSTASPLKLPASIAPVQPQDGVFIFYAGHGSAEGRHFYLMPEDYNPDAALSSPDSHAVSELDLSQWLEGIAPEHSFLILDACESGEAIQTSGPLGPLNATGLAQLAYEKGIYILAAAKESESAVEAARFGGGHGLLTYALVEEGLREGAAAQEGTLELRHWFLYASRRVPELQTGDSRERRPVLLGSAPVSVRTATQHPRLLYRREPESTPFVIAKFPEAPSH